MTPARGVLSWSAAWVASALLWVVLTDSVRIEEMLAGALVAALAATGFEVARRQRLAPEGIRPSLARRTWRVLVQVAPDVWRLTRAAFGQVAQRRARRGEVVAIPFRQDGGAADAAARRAVAAAVGSVAPNSIVVGVDPDSGTMLVHQLEPTRKPSELDPLGLR
ncbi:MAG TPA: Na+/H+ antiporter subunit E [Thermoleophilaceae bacterium]|jgi:multisubunit Na+/H+ antiporter MnhE subunit|nr:Na+/H+ antiporter subunit E [Thermoleophilaceae bacterium]